MTAFSLTPLRELASVFNGKTPSKTEHREQGHPVIKIRDVDENGVFRGPFESFVEDTFAARHSERFAADGDTLILNAAHNADYVGSKTFFVSGECVGALATGEWLIVRPISSRLDARYINHWLRTIIARHAIRNLVKGIHLYPKDVERLNVPLPSLSQQRRIAEILDQADGLRRTRRLTLERVDGLHQAVFVEMFGDPAKNSKPLPTKALGDLMKVRSGDALIGANQNGGSYPVYGGNGINGWHDQYIVPANTIVIGRVGVYCGAVHVTDRNAWVTDNALIVEIKSGSLLTTYLAAALKYADLNQYAGQSAQPLVSGSRIYPVKILTPPIGDQNVFGDRFAEVERLRSLYRAHLAKLEALFASLQHRAFTDELTSKDVERELAIAG